MKTKRIKCPNCSSEETGNLECHACLGSGYKDNETHIQCEECEGAGYSDGTMACLDCGNEFDTH